MSFSNNNSKSTGGVIDTTSQDIDIGVFTEVESTSASITGGVTAGSISVSENIQIAGTLEANEAVIETSTLGDIIISTNELSLVTGSTFTNIQISGNLFINGQLTVAQLSFSDPLLRLGRGNTNNSADRGIHFFFNSDLDGFFLYCVQDDIFRLFTDKVRK